MQCLKLSMKVEDPCHNSNDKLKRFEGFLDSNSIRQTPRSPLFDPLLIETYFNNNQISLIQYEHFKHNKGAK